MPDGYKTRKLWLVPTANHAYVLAEKILDGSLKVFTTDFEQSNWAEIEGLPDGNYFTEMGFEGEFRGGIDNEGALWLWGKERANSGVVLDDDDNSQENITKAYRVSYFREANLKVQKIEVGQHHLVA